MATYADQVLADSPLVYYRFAETSGSTYVDSSGNGRDGTWVSSSVLKGQSSLLNSQPDGKSAILPAATANSLGSATVGDLTTGKTGLTFEAWIKFGDTFPTSGSHTILTMNGNQGLGLTVNNSVLYLGARHNTNTTSTSTTAPSGTTPVAGETYHFAVVFEDLGSTVQIRQYVNGSLSSTSTASTITNLLAWASGTVVVGMTNRTYSLQIDEAAIYPTALSASRISTHYDYGVAYQVANTVAPAVTGTAQVGQTLSTTDGTWTGTTPITYARAWERSDNGSTGWAAISGATSSTYTLTSAEAGKYLRSKITATNLLGSESATSTSTSQVTWTPANTVAPTISGTASVGSTFTSSAGTWTGYPTPDLTYAWQRSSTGTSGWANISGATASTYTATSDDAGQHLRLTVTGSSTAGSASASSSSAGPVIWAPANTVLPALTHDGVLEVGNPITASAGTWTGYPTPDLSYQWQRSTDGATNWSSISGATSSTYTPTGTDSGKYLRCRVIGESTSGSATVFSAASSYVAADPATVIAPSVSGLLRPGQVLTANVGTWSGFPNPSFTYQWLKSPTGSTGWEAIPGKTDPTLTIAGGSITLGNFYRVEVTGTNEAGSASAASAAVGPVTSSGSNPTAAIVGALVAASASSAGI